MVRHTDGVRRRIAFDFETWHALDRLAKDRLASIQELAGIPEERMACPSHLFRFNGAPRAPKECRRSTRRSAIS
jgi:hypothetical protein